MRREVNHAYYLITSDKKLISVGFWEARLALGDHDYYGEEAALESHEPGIWSQELDEKTELPIYQSGPVNINDYSNTAEVSKPLPVAYAASEAGTVYDEDAEQESDFGINSADQEWSTAWNDEPEPDASIATEPECIITTESFISKSTLTIPANDSSLPSSPPTRMTKRRRADEEEDDCLAGRRYDYIALRRKRKRMSSGSRE